MASGSLGERSNHKGRVWIAVCFLFAAAGRTGFALAFPTIHGGDAAARLAHPDTLVLGYQLPLPQVFVFVGRALLDDPILTRIFFCVWGAVLAAGVGALLAETAGPIAALFGALLCASDPLLIHYSIVPYQEPVAYGLLAWAFALAISGRGRLATLVMGAACLSRYEVWLFLPVFVWVCRPPRVAALAFLPVLGWILRWGGLAPGGLYVLDLDPGADRMSRVFYLGSKLLEYETAIPVALAGIGLAVAVWSRDKSLLALIATLVLVVAIVVGLGHEYPPGSGLMSERLIHLPVLLCLPLAAVALGRLAETSRLAFATCLTLALALAGRNIRFETALLRAAAKEPDLALARDVAEALEANRQPGECVTVDAPRVDPALLRAYVSKVGASFGDVARARDRANELKDSSPDRDRIAAQLKAKTGTIRAETGCPLLVAIDSGSSEPGSATLVAEVSAGPRHARILRIRP